MEKKAIISVFFDEEKGGEHENEFITALNLTGTKKTNYWTIPSLPLKELLDELDEEEILAYEGSLTVPPCSEAVDWILIHDPQPISSEQLDLFNKKWLNNQTFANGNGNNRAAQLLGERKIYFYGESFSAYLSVGVKSVLFTVVLILTYYL